MWKERKEREKRKRGKGRENGRWPHVCTFWCPRCAWLWCATQTKPPALLVQKRLDGGVDWVCARKCHPVLVALLFLNEGHSFLRNGPRHITNHNEPDGLPNWLPGRHRWACDERCCILGAVTKTDANLPHPLCLGTLRSHGRKQACAFRQRHQEPHNHKWHKENLKLKKGLFILLYQFKSWVLPPWIELGFFFSPQT